MIAKRKYSVPTVVAAIAFIFVPVAGFAKMPPVDSVAPDFTLRSSGGKNIKLSELRGQVVLVNFWATWCGPCREELPHLNRLYQQYRRAGFVLLGVNIDDKPANARSMAERLGVKFPILFDPTKVASKKYDVDAMPATLIVDRDGRIRYLHRGYRAGDEKEYEARIREVLK